MQASDNTFCTDYVYKLLDSVGSVPAFIFCLGKQAVQEFVIHFR